MPKKRTTDPEVENAVAIATHLATAANLLISQSIPLLDYPAYLEQGMLRHAWEQLRSAAENHPVPFSFWSEMSKAADLMGAP